MDRAGEPVGEDAVDLPDVAHGVLARGSLERHGTVERDEAVHAVAATDLAGVGALGRRPRHGHVDAVEALARLVEGVEHDRHLVERPQPALDLLDELGVESCLELEVVCLASDVTVDERRRDRELELAAAPDAVDLHVLADPRAPPPRIGIVQETLGVEHELLGLRERREAHADGRVVRPGPARVGEHVRELRRARAEHAPHVEVPLRVDVAEVLAEPAARRGDRELANVDALDLGRTIAEVELHGLEDAPTAEPRFRAAGDEERLVGVVVLDRSRTLQVDARERL